MKTARIMVTQKAGDRLESDLLVYCLKQEEKGAPDGDAVIRELVEGAYKLKDFSGKPGEQLLAYQQAVGNGILAKRLLIIGLGKMDEKTPVSEISETLRKTGGSIAEVCAKTRVGTLAVSLPRLAGLNLGQTARFLSEGLILGDYRFDKYKEQTKKKDDYKGIRTVRLSAPTRLNQVRAGVKQGVVAATVACKARDMANEPGNGWTSMEFARYARDLAKDHGLACTCLEKEDLEKLGMGGILAVNQGSAIPPRMVILDYKPQKKADTILLVGKGITFDSGGISLKPPAGMDEMKYDMCGGAAVLTAMQAVALEKPDVRVVAIVPATDNMSGSSAVRPGDIIRHYNGVTSEIVNTDAEGRMILGDALAYGIETYTPDCVIDIATLTGAVIFGLGHHYSGLISNHDILSDRISAAGNEAGEPVWRLPLNKDYKKQIESKVADIKNVGGRPAGTITAGAYLSNFVGETPWAHLDIAGTAWDFTKKSYIPKGPSGIGVRTFLYLIRSWENGVLKK